MKFLPEGTGLLLSASSIFAMLLFLIRLCKKKARALPERDGEKSRAGQEGNRSGYLVSLILNWILKMALVPIVALSIISIFPTIMMTDGGVNILAIAVIIFLLGVFWYLPVTVYHIMKLSEKYRENGHIRLSIVIQSLTIVVVSIPFLLLFVF